MRNCTGQLRFSIDTYRTQTERDLVMEIIRTYLYKGRADQVFHLGIRLFDVELQQVKSNGEISVSETGRPTNCLYSPTCNELLTDECDDVIVDLNVCIAFKSKRELFNT